MWPWRRRIDEARKELAEAEQRKSRVDELIEQSRRVATRFQQEIDQNGFTEILLHTMQRGH